MFTTTFNTTYTTFLVADSLTLKVGSLSCITTISTTYTTTISTTNTAKI